ncbi:hypothetical protein ACFC1I_11915, partial [Microbacterium sp. NPDC056044]
VESHLLHDDDLYAANTLEDRERVGVREAEASVDGDLLSLALPAVSWTAIRLASMEAPSEITRITAAATVQPHYGERLRA